MSSAFAACLFATLLLLLLGGAVIGRSRARTNHGVHVASIRYVTGAAPRSPVNKPMVAPSFRNAPPTWLDGPRGMTGLTWTSLGQIGIPSGPQMSHTGTYAAPTHVYALGASGPGPRGFSEPSDVVLAHLRSLQVEIDELKKGRS